MVGAVDRQSAHARVRPRGERRFVAAIDLLSKDPLCLVQVAAKAKLKLRVGQA